METFTLKHRGISIFQFSRPACKWNEGGGNESTEGGAPSSSELQIKTQTGALQHGGQTKLLPKGPEMEATSTLKPLQLFKDHAQDCNDIFGLNPTSHFYPYSLALGTESRGVMVEIFPYEMGHPPPRTHYVIRSLLL